eukprot:jgi/Bigna1/131617/aug1.15_g6325
MPDGEADNAEAKSSPMMIPGGSSSSRVYPISLKSGAEEEGRGRGGGGGRFDSQLIPAEERVALMRRKLFHPLFGPDIPWFEEGAGMLSSITDSEAYEDYDKTNNSNSSSNNTTTNNNNNDNGSVIRPPPSDARDASARRGFIKKRKERKKKDHIPTLLLRHRPGLSKLRRGGFIMGR